MKVSNALPIQFWPADQQTYNEKEVCGIEAHCFCQPVECADEIYLQIYDYDTPEHYNPIVIDSDGAIIYDPHGFGSEGVHFFTPQEQDICDGEYQILIYDSDLSIELLEPSAWSDGANAFDSKTDEQFIKGSMVSNTGYTATQPAAIAADQEPISINIHIEMAGNPPNNPWSVSFGLLDGGSNVIWNAGLSGLGDFDQDVTLEFTRLIDGPATILQVGAIFTALTGATPNIEITIEPGAILSFADAILYKSDCLDIRTEHPCTNIIAYHNDKDFAGLRYDDLSPTPVFELRVPTVLFHEFFPREDEVQALSNDTFRRVFSSLTRKVKLEIGYIPYYLIQKLNIIWMHDHIEIDGTEYVVQDAHEVPQGNKRYPLKRSEVLLTDKNFIERNLI